MRRPPLAVPATSYYVPSEHTSPRFARAFAAGCGGRTSLDLTRLQDGPFAAFCTPATWPLLDRAMRIGRTYYYGDHGWFRRGRQYRIAKNAVQYQPTLRDLAAARPYRLRSCSVETRTGWKTDGRAVVVCPNSTIYMARFGLDAHRWTHDVVEQLQAVTDRPIIVRWKAQARQRPLVADLADAWIVVVYSSGAAVEALVHGVPVVTLAPWASTVDMGLTDLAQVESPIYPDRRLPFLWALAERQWSFSEITSGVAWRALNP